MLIIFPRIAKPESTICRLEIAVVLRTKGFTGIPNLSPQRRMYEPKHRQASNRTLLSCPAAGHKRTTNIDGRTATDPFCKRSKTTTSPGATGHQVRRSCRNQERKR